MLEITHEIADTLKSGALYLHRKVELGHELGIAWGFYLGYHEDLEGAPEKILLGEMDRKGGPQLAKRPCVS